MCKEKQAAFNTYDDALAGGHGGYLLDKGNERGGRGREGGERERRGIERGG